MHRTYGIVWLTVIAPLTGALLAGEVSDWPSWRGPNRDGVSRETGLLRSWNDAGPKLIWTASGVGQGYPSVVVGGGLVYTMGKRENDVLVFAIENSSGKQRWERQIGNTGRNAMSTPTLDAERLYALDPDGRLVCLDSKDGRILWQKRFVEDFGGRPQSGRGYGESPLVDGEKLVCTPGGAESTLVALNKQTGVVIWRSRVPHLGERGRDGAAFSSIVPTEAGGVRQYVQLLGRGVAGVAAADGKFLWGYNRVANTTANMPTPVVRGDLVFASTGYNAGAVLIKLLPDGNGGVRAQEEYFLNAGVFQNHHGGMVLVGDHVYGGHGSNNGLPTCIDLRTGEVVWKTRGPGTGSAAVVYADGHLYCRYQDGVMALIEATTEGYKLKGTFKIPGAAGDSWSHPVVAGGRLYLREQNQLSVYDVKAP